MGDSPTSGMPIYTVHTMKPDEIGAVEIVFTDERDARAFAQNRSTDLRVISASVTRFVIGELGTRRPVTWYVDGREQPRHYDRQVYPTDGSDHGPEHAKQRRGPQRPPTSGDLHG